MPGVSEHVGQSLTVAEVKFNLKSKSTGNARPISNTDNEKFTAKIWQGQAAYIINGERRLDILADRLWGYTVRNVNLVVVECYSMSCG